MTSTKRALRRALHVVVDVETICPLCTRPYVPGGRWHVACARCKAGTLWGATERAVLGVVRGTGERDGAMINAACIPSAMARGN